MGPISLKIIHSLKSARQAIMEAETVLAAQGVTPANHEKIWRILAYATGYLRDVDATLFDLGQSITRPAAKSS